MSLKIRMSRAGAKKRPFFRIVVADTRMPRDGRFIERVGSYNPLLPKEHENRVELSEERIRHWLSVGAQPSERVHRFLDAAGILKRDPRNNPEKGKPGQKRLDREAARREAEAKAKEEAEAAAAQAGAGAPAEESAEEPPAEESAATQEAAEETPAETAAAGETAAEEAPAQDAPGKETAAAEEAPAEEGEEKKE